MPPMLRNINMVMQRPPILDRLSVTTNPGTTPGQVARPSTHQHSNSLSHPQEMLQATRCFPSSYALLCEVDTSSGPDANDTSELG